MVGYPSLGTLKVVGHHLPTVSFKKLKRESLRVVGRHPSPVEAASWNPLGGLVATPPLSIFKKLNQTREPPWIDHRP